MRESPIFAGFWPSGPSETRIWRRFLRGLRSPSLSSFLSERGLPAAAEESLEVRLFRIAAYAISFTKRTLSQGFALGYFCSLPSGGVYWADCCIADLLTRLTARVRRPALQPVGKPALLFLAPLPFYFVGSSATGADAGGTFGPIRTPSSSDAATKWSPAARMRAIWKPVFHQTQVMVLGSMA